MLPSTVVGNSVECSNFQFKETKWDKIIIQATAKRTGIL